MPFSDPKLKDRYFLTLSDFFVLFFSHAMFFSFSLIYSIHVEIDVAASIYDVQPVEDKYLVRSYLSFSVEKNISIVELMDQA